MMERLKFETSNGITENSKKLMELFPEAVVEGKGDDGKLKRGVDFEKLCQLLSEDMIDGDEKYEFTWVGKREAVREAGRPIRKTLRPSAGGGGKQKLGYHREPVHRGR